MSNGTREVPSLNHIKKQYEDKNTTVKFIYRGRNKKITLLLFRERSNEEFLCSVQDVEN